MAAQWAGSQFEGLVRAIHEEYVNFVHVNYYTYRLSLSWWILDTISQHLGMPKFPSSATGRGQSH